MWNPQKYLTFAGQRARPFFDLLSQVGAESPRRIVDLGCGPGNLTEVMIQRWPDAAVEAVDSSPEMVAAANERGVNARLGDISAFAPQPDTDVLLSNAALQWIPEHADLMVGWVGRLEPGAWMAVQVPGNFTATSHASVRVLADQAKWSNLLEGIPFRRGEVVETPARYAERLRNAGCSVNAWETTYIHELEGEHPVLDWISGTSLGPVRERLSDQQWQEFRSELIPMLAKAYPRRPDGRTWYPFRRIFIVAQVLPR